MTQFANQESWFVEHELYISRPQKQKRKRKRIQKGCKKQKREGKESITKPNTL